jgi:predicted amidohydrolase YtcJ
MKLPHVLLALAIFAVCACQQPHETADLVFTGGTIYTVDDAQPVVEAVAVKEGKILFAGDEAAARKYVGEKTRVIGLHGETMTPGFIDGHAHIMEVGYNELELDLATVESYEELVELVREAAKKAPPGQWILGRGWHQDKWAHAPKVLVKGFQTHALLSSASPDNPVFLWHASGHAAIANAKAMEMAGVNQIPIEKLPTRGSSERGEIIRDDLGNPTGIFTENAMNLIAKHIPENSAERDEEALRRALQACARNGITGLHDAGASRSSLRLFEKLRKENRLTVRLYAMVAGWDADLLHEWLARGPQIDPAHFLTIRSIKLSCDGALGSRGAWLLEPYTDRPGFYGMATTPMDTVLSVARQALEHGFQLCSHAIGDRTNREVLDQYEVAIKENPEKAKDHRFRIEHAQHLHPLDIPRFAQLGVIASMQAIHMSSDRPWAIDRLGEKRIKEGAYAWRSLISTGAKIINGTDSPVEPLNPIACFYAAVTRKTLKGEPAGGYEPEQKMTREEALQSYTINGAYGGFQEKFLGSIEAGKCADFTVFSRDIMTVPETEILGTEVVMTVVNGQVIYQK